VSWVRIDDQAPRHRKMLQAGPAACWLWVCALAHCQSQFTDGFLPDLVLPMIGITGASRAKKLADVLVSVGLFERAEGGYRIHDYHVYNLPASTARSRRDKITAERRNAGQKGGAASGASRARRAEQVTEANADDFASNKKPRSNEAPSHPIPEVPPNPPSGGLLGNEKPTLPERFIADPEITDRAATLLERYPQVYAKARSGAASPIRESRDWPKALELAAKFTDAERLCLMAEVFLKRTDIGPKNIPGTLGQFAHMAPDCDRLLREHGR
jgi:hypothetical protein